MSLFELKNVESWRILAARLHLFLLLEFLLIALFDLFLFLSIEVRSLEDKEFATVAHTLQFKLITAEAIYSSSELNYALEGAF